MTSDFQYDYLEPLTNREMDVLKLLAQGSSNQNIANALVIEVTTVKWYNSQIYDKLQVKNRKQAVIRAQTLGILEADSTDPLLRVQHNLPSDTFPFIGREQELKELIHYLAGETFRLTTILGAGGMGKSRLSIEVGRRLLPRFLQGVYFIPLAPVISPEQIITTIADVIGFKFQGDAQAKKQLLDYLQNQNMLLIIDNFEHLIESASLLTDILNAAPNIKILVTSREKLGLRGEVVFLIEGLSTLYRITKDVTTDDAVKLFLETAQRIFIQENPQDIKTIASICQLLGGMPLAILLAAAWVDTLSLNEILEEIREGLDILEANLRDSPERHQSIETVFDTTWKRLSEKEQNVFMKLSVFRDGFTREAAKTVAGASIRDLQRLVHTSFIQYQSSGRYTIHELIRQYGNRKLKSSNEHDTVQDEYARFFADFITLLGNIPWGMATDKELEPVYNDYENIRAAWLYRSKQKNIPELTRFLDGLWMFYDQYSRSQEGINLFEPLLTTIQGNSDEINLFHGQILTRLGWFYNDVGQPQKSYTLVEQALLIIQKYHSTNDIMLAHFQLFLQKVLIPDLEACEIHAQKGYELALKTDGSKWVSPFCVAVSTCLYISGKVEQAEALISTLPEFKFRITITNSWMLERRKFVELEARILSGFKKYHLHRIEYILWYSALVECAIQMKQFKKAWSYLRDGLQYGDDGAYTWGTFMMLNSALEILIAQHDYIRATELLAVILQHPANIESNRANVIQLKEDLVDSLSSNEFKAAWERGKNLNLEDVITDLMER